MLDDFIKLLTNHCSLSKDQVVQAIDELVDEQIVAEKKAEFLLALARKGESVEEIAAFAWVLREKSIPPRLDAATRAREILDVCGTGGDGLQTFNISTTVALVAAAAGVTVAKHGNRAVTSQAGSADVLEELGIRTILDPEEAGTWLRDHHFAFFFAPHYHPAFRHIGPARRLCAERGQRTIFNFLGPLLNPARPAVQLVGVPHPRLCEPLAQVLQSLGVRRGMVVSGRAAGGHLDELSILEESTMAEIAEDRAIRVSTLFPAAFPLQPATLDDLRGGDRRVNAETIRRLLEGEERGPKRDAVLLNAAAALWLGGKARSIVEGWDLAGQLLDSGQARAKLEELQAASRARP